MGIYLDLKHRCDNCLHELPPNVTPVPCKGVQMINYYDCQKRELCPVCVEKGQGWCNACVEKGQLLSNIEVWEQNV